MENDAPVAANDLATRLRAEQAASPLASSAAAHPLGLVVVADDESPIRAAMPRLLDSQGDRIIVAGSEAEASALLAAEPRRPDAILCEYRLRAGERLARAAEAARQCAAAGSGRDAAAGDVDAQMRRPRRAAAIACTRFATLRARKIAETSALTVFSVTPGWRPLACSSSSRPRQNI